MFIFWLVFSYVLMFGSLCDCLNVQSWFDGRKCVGTCQNMSKPWLKTWGRPWHMGMHGYGQDASMDGYVLVGHQ